MKHPIIPWRCKNRHILGEVTRDASGIQTLMLYRQAVDLKQEELNEVDILSVAKVDKQMVKCSICGDVRKWLPGEKAKEKVIERMENQKNAKVSSS